MNARLDWDDFATLLAIAEAGSLAAAGRREGHSRPTLLRRLNLIERALGAELFVRHRAGYRPTPAGDALLEAARQMRSLAREAERNVADRDTSLAGRVVLTTTDTLFAGLIAPLLDGFGAAHPGITLDVRVTNTVDDLFRREADIALRPTRTPDGALVGRRLGVVRQAVFTAAIREKGEARSVGPSPDMPYQPLRASLEREGMLPCAVETNSILATYFAVRGGAGSAILPTYLGDADPALIRIGAPLPELDTDLWLLTEPSLRHHARIRAVLDHLSRSEELRSRLESGRSPA